MKKMTVLLLVGVMVMNTLAGCGKKEAENVAEGSSAVEAVEDTVKHLNVGIKGNGEVIPSLDPAKDSWTATRWGIGERLFRINENLEVEGWLVESYEAIDELTWKMTLRDDVYFSNGKKMDGEAVKANLDRVLETSTAKSKMKIASVEADGQILTIKTEEVNAALPNSMSDQSATILDIESLDEEGEIPVGTGPFVIESWEPGTYNLVANENYWACDVMVDTITITEYADGNAMAMALDNGEIDLTFQLPTENMEQFIGTDDFDVVETTGSRSQILFFDYENELLADVNVRKAISMAIDRETYAKGINKGHSEAATALWPVTMAYGKVPGLEYNVEEAKKILSDAGYTDSNNNGTLDKAGKELNFRLHTYGAHGALLPSYAEAIQAALKELGIGIEIVLNDWAGHFDVTRAGGFDLDLESFIMAAAGDPQYLTDRMLKTDAEYNVGHYSNAEVDKLIDELSKEFDVAKRQEIAVKIQEHIVEDCGLFTLGHLKYSIVANKKVTGYSTHASEYYFLTENLDIKMN